MAPHTVATFARLINPKTIAVKFQAFCLFTIAEDFFGSCGSYGCLASFFVILLFLLWLSCSENMVSNFFFNFFRVFLSNFFSRLLAIIFRDLKNLGVFFVVIRLFIILVFPIDNAWNWVKSLLNLFKVQTPGSCLSRGFYNGQFRIAKMHIGRCLAAPVNWSKRW